MRGRTAVAKLVATAFVAVSVIVAGATYAMLPTASQSPPNTASNSQNGGAPLQAQSSCADTSPISYTYPTPTNNLPVLVLQPGSTVEVCVTYVASWTRPNTLYSDIQSAFFPSGTYSFP